jgi:hypothetical protein
MFATVRGRWYFTKLCFQHGRVLPPENAKFSKIRRRKPEELESVPSSAQCGFERERL